MLSAFFPVISNAIIIGLEITLFMPEGFKLEMFLITAAQVGIGELVICYGLGIPLYKVMKKRKLDKKL